MNNELIVYYPNLPQRKAKGANFTLCLKKLNFHLKVFKESERSLHLK